MNLFSTTLKRPARRTNLDEESAAEVLLSKDVPAIPPPTDRELLTLWLEHKDTSALEAIIRRHGPLVRSLSSRLLRSHHEQADAFQTVFLVVSQNASRIRHRESLASWIYGVTVRTCLMFSRQRSRHDPIPEETEAPSFPRQEVLEHQELVLTLNKELDLLPSHLRESLVLVYLEGYSRQAAADLTNTTEQTIKSRLARGRNLLRTRLLKRGVTFSTAFTLFSVTTTADADTLTIPDLLLNKTLDTCQTGQLPLTFPSVPLDPIAIVPTGVPLMSSTTFYGTLAVATLLLLTTLGMGNRGKADGQEAVTSAIDTSINELIPEIDELTPSVMIEPQIASSASTTPQSAIEAKAVEQSPLPMNQAETVSTSSPVSEIELSLLDREIALFKEAEKTYREDVEKFQTMSSEMFSQQYIFGDRKGVTPETAIEHRIENSKSKLKQCTEQLALLESQRQQLIANNGHRLNELGLVAEEAKLRHQLDSASAQLDELLSLRLRIFGYKTEANSVVDYLLEPTVPNPEEKIARLKSEIPDLKAKIIDLTQRHAQVKSKLNAPVGSAVRTINPPTVATAPPAVADVDLSVGTANARSMELQLLEIEIEMLEGSIESTELVINQVKENPKHLIDISPYIGLGDLINAPEEERAKALSKFSESKKLDVEKSKNQLVQLQQRKSELLAKKTPVSEEHSRAEIEARRLDSLIEQKKEMYQKILLARLVKLGQEIPQDSVIDSEIGSLDTSKIDELKFEILKLAIEKQQAEQALQSMQTASPTPSLPAPVGSAVRTVGPPTTPIAPPAVADVDLSPNPINPQPAPNLPPLKQSEQSLLDLKVERAELNEKYARELAESEFTLEGPNVVQLKFLDAKIALQEALLERERFRAEQEAELPLKSEIPSELSETGEDQTKESLSHTDTLIMDLRRVQENYKHLAKEEARKPYPDNANAGTFKGMSEIYEKKIQKLITEQIHKGDLPLAEPEPCRVSFASTFRGCRMNYLDANGLKRGIIFDHGGSYTPLRLGVGRHQIELIFDEQQFWPSEPQRFPGTLELFDPSTQDSKYRYCVFDAELTKKLIEGEIETATMFFWVSQDSENTENKFKVSMCEALSPGQSEEDVLKKIESKQGKLLAILRLGERLNNLNPPRDPKIIKSKIEPATTSAPALTQSLPQKEAPPENAGPAEHSVDPAKQAELTQLKTRYRHLLDEYRKYRPDLIEDKRRESIGLSELSPGRFKQNQQVVSYLEKELQKIDVQVDEQTTGELSELRRGILEQIKKQLINDLSKLEAIVVKLEIDNVKKPLHGPLLEEHQRALNFTRQQVADINEELKASSFTATNSKPANSSLPPSIDEGAQARPIETYSVDAMSESSVSNKAISSESPPSPAQAKPSADKLKIRLNSEVPLTAIYKDPSDPTKEITLDINNSRSSTILGEFPNARTEIVLQTKSQTTAETFSYPVVLEFRDGIDLSKIPLFFNTVQIDLTQSDYELLRQSRFEVYLYTVERPGRKQIAENGRFVEGPNETLCIALPRGRADNARLSDEAFRKVVESKQTVIATLRSEALTSTKPQTSNPSHPAPAAPSPTPKTLGVKFSNDFNAKLTFDKLTLPEPDTGAVQPIPAGVHPVTLTYKSSDNDQTFSQPLILEVLPEINELDMGELSGDFQLTLDNLALMQKGLFGQALVAYDRPNNRITASGRVGSGALVSQINTIVDLETIRAGAKDFNSNLRTFGRDPQQRGHIVAILYSPDYDKNVKFRHEYYSPRSSRGFSRGSGPTEWSLLTPDGIPAIGTAVELFYVNAEASSIEDLRIESADPDAPVTQKFKIAEVTANDIYLSPMDQSRTSLQPLSRSFFFQQAKEKYLILVPKDKYTPETLTTEIWNKLHPLAKD